jgi:glycosyltransferase involved in cell wall biosynthesis
MSPRLAIDVRMAHDAGIGTYIRNVVPRVLALRADWTPTLIAAPNDRLDWLPGGAVIRRSGARVYSVREQVDRVWMTRGADLLWVPHYNVPLLSRVPLAVTVHDVLHIIHPGSRLRLEYARAMFRRVRRAAGVTFVSRFTAEEFVERVGRPMGPHAVVPNGVDASWWGGEAGARPHPREYILFVGSMKPHKNLRTLLAAFHQIAGRVPHDLLVIGRRKGMRTTDHESLDAIDRDAARIRWVGEVDELQLRNHMAHAAAFVMPSLYEGFGLPPLEAMAAGVPCLVSNAGALPETCGNAALTFDPHSAESLAGQLLVLLTDPSLRADLREKGVQRAGQMTWEMTARGTTGLLARAMPQ